MYVSHQLNYCLQIISFCSISFWVLKLYWLIRKSTQGIWKSETLFIKVSFIWLSGYIHAFVYPCACILLWICLSAAGSVLDMYFISSPKFQGTCQLATKFGLAGRPPSLATALTWLIQASGNYFVFQCFGIIGFSPSIRQENFCSA